MLLTLGLSGVLVKAEKSSQSDLSVVLGALKAMMEELRLLEIRLAASECKEQALENSGKDLYNIIITDTLFEEVMKKFVQQSFLTLCEHVLFTICLMLFYDKQERTRKDYNENSQSSVVFFCTAMQVSSQSPSQASTSSGSMPWITGKTSTWMQHFTITTTDSFKTILGWSWACFHPCSPGALSGWCSTHASSCGFRVTDFFEYHFNIFSGFLLFHMRVTSVLEAAEIDFDSLNK